MAHSRVGPLTTGTGLLVCVEPLTTGAALRLCGCVFESLRQPGAVPCRYCVLTYAIGARHVVT